MVVGEMIEKFRKTSLEKIRKTSFEKLRKTSIETLDKLRKTSRSRSNRRYSGSEACTSVEYAGLLKILLLGDQGVGKTTICAQYTFDNELLQTLTEEDSKQETYSTCVYISCGVKRAKQYDLEISIANGVYWRDSVHEYKEKIMDSHAFMLVYSKENRQSYMRLVELLSDIRRIKKMVDVPVVIVGNKNDLNLINALQVRDSDHIVLGECPHFDVSALDNNGIQEAFKCLSQMCAQTYDPQESIKETEEIKGD